MGLKTFTIDFAEFSQETLGRSNYKTVILGIEIKSADYEQEGLPLIRIGDVGNDFDENNMVFLPENYREDYQRLLLKKNDIIVSLTGDGKLKSDLILKDDKYLLNQRVGSLRAKENINVLFFYYLINYYSLTKKQFYWWSNGKTQLNISPFDFLNIKIPLIPKPTQDQIVAQIEPIEKKIKKLKAQIKEAQEIINKVFARKFSFDLEKFEKSKKEKFVEVSFSKISNYHSLRYDVKNQIYLDIFNEIIKDFRSSFFLKSLSKDKGKYGANKPAKDGEKSFDTRYIRITDIDSIGNLNDDDWKTSENIDKQYLLKDDDFLFARSGNTVGKTFLYNSEKHEEAIYAGYFIKFQLDFTNLNKLFFLYYTKSFIYNFWVKGIVRIKGQPNINANEYLELKIPNIPLSTQQKIVDEIKTELDQQEKIKSKIKNERNRIDEIIEKAIK